jgi:hypothetical protein
MGAFLNELDANLLVAIVVFIVVIAPVFGYFYNRLMDSLKSDHEHTSLYVAIGVAITLAFGSLLSWKAAILLLSIFCLTGLPMIVGEFLRTERKRKSAPRRKRLPYAANGILDEAKMANSEAVNQLERAINSNRPEEIYKHIAAALAESHRITSKLAEVKQIQIEK